MKLSAILLCILFTTCHHIDSLEKSKDFSLGVSFEQSFASPIQFKLSRRNAKTEAVVTVTSLATNLLQSDTAQLSETDLQDFLKKVEHTPLFSLSSLPLYYKGDTDGQTTFVTVKQNGKTNTFQFDYASRKKATQYYILLDAVFDLMYKRFGKFESFIEENQEKLDYGLAIKERGKNPLIIRMYGTYHKDTKAAQQYLYNLPKNKKIIIDFSNLGTIHFIIDAVVAIEKTHPKIAWVTGDQKSDWARKDVMVDRGLDTTRMFRNTVTAEMWMLQKFTN